MAESEENWEIWMRMSSGRLEKLVVGRAGIECILGHGLEEPAGELLRLVFDGSTSLKALL